MRTVKKEIKLGDLVPTALFVQSMFKEDNQKAVQEVLRLTGLGILQVADPNDPLEKTPSEMEEMKISGLRPFEYDINLLVEKIGEEGYHPNEHTHIKVYKDNVIVDGCKRLQALKRLYGDDYVIEVKEIIED